MSEVFPVTPWGAKVAKMAQRHSDRWIKPHAPRLTRFRFNRIMSFRSADTHLAIKNILKIAMMTIRSFKTIRNTHFGNFFNGKNFRNFRIWIIQNFSALFDIIDQAKNIWSNTTQYSLESRISDYFENARFGRFCASFFKLIVFDLIKYDL